MASKKKIENEKTKTNKLSLGIKDETKHGIYALISFVLALFFVLSAFRGAGRAGIFFYTLFTFLFGWGYALMPVLCLILGISFVRSIRPNVGWSHTLSSFLFLCASLGIIDLVSGIRHGGGYLGKVVAFPFIKLFDVYTSAIFLSAILLISLFILFDTRPQIISLFEKITSLFKSNKKVLVEGMEAAPVEESGEENEEETKDDEVKEKKMREKTKTAEEEFPIEKAHRYSGEYVPPPLSLLEEDTGKPNVGDIKANANIIKRTLANFGIEVEMDEITIGPTVTRYALKPAEGVKLSRIVGLQNDLGLALAAHPLRIEAPIPGKSLVGIEVPNKTKATVGLASLLKDDKFKNAPKPLMIALGRAINGRPQFANLAKMPHALIAGTTGSGKSVTIHSIITSLLYRNSPEDLRLIMIDPKRVELTLYNKIPHLLTPVITDAKKAILSLKWAATEMSRRYDILESEQVRDIESYHNTVWGGKKAKAKKGNEDPGEAERMPYIVIVIDELADIMSSYPRELESGIVRLAQMSRAVGIHIILSTQRPEVNVITGLIKANIPARIALKVASQIDSRTILDAGGAEKLLGAGDMLYSSGDAQPERLQSAFISEGEVKKVVKYLSDAYKDDIGGDEIAFTGTITADKSIFESTLDGEGDSDDLYEEARQVVIEAGKASTSFLQRKLGVGYSRAARLIDMLEEHGVIGPGSGSKPRDILEKSVGEERAEFPTE